VRNYVKRKKLSQYFVSNNSLVFRILCLC